MSLPFYKYSKSLLYFIKEYFNNYKDALDIDVKRKIFLVKLFSTVGFIFLLAFGLSSLFHERYAIAAAVLSAALATVINLVIFAKTENHVRACNGVSLIVISISFYLMLTGGVEGTGPLWAYVSVPLVLFLQGVKSGLKIISAFIAGVIVMMFFPSDFYAYTSYSFAFKTRFLASYFAIVVLSWFCEYARYQAQQRWYDLSCGLADQARTDVLTGISNRRDILEKLEYENMRSKRRQEMYSVLLIDVDHFKDINDSYGHDSGDLVLKNVSRAIQRNLFERDLLGRWGGEEFIVVLPDTDAVEGLHAAEKIRQSIEDMEIYIDKNRIKITISIGLAASDKEYQFSEYIKFADRRLYQAKAEGRNCVVGNLIPLTAEVAN